jgi:CRISPR-associated protein Cas1
MKLLLLNGYGMNFRVEKAKLHITDGRYADDIEPKQYVFSPKKIDIDNIVVYGRTGEISIESIRWLVKHGVAITLLDWNGKLLTVITPPESVQVKTKFAQYSSYRDNNLRLEIAQDLIRGKIERTKAVLEWLKSKYSDIEYDFSVEEERLEDSLTLNEVMMAEARVAKKYWGQLAKIIPEKLEFDGRKTVKKPFGAGDYVNCMLNYGYSILEAECIRAINSVGLDVHVGFLHEMKIGCNSLAYDMQEPFRFLIDIAIISAIEKDKLNSKDFIRTENYNLRLKSSGAKKIIEEINLQFNKKVKYKGQLYSWSYVLITQIRELAHYFLGLKRKIDFTKPEFDIEREDTEEIRTLISNISYKKWKDLGFSKGTLHPMKQKAIESKPFYITENVKKRLLSKSIIQRVLK